MKMKRKKKGGGVGKIGKVGQSLSKTISETIKCDIQTKVMSLLGYIYRVLENILCDIFVYDIYSEVCPFMDILFAEMSVFQY